MKYAIILLAVLIISPFVISLASKQDKKSKLKLKSYLIIILIFQIIMGFFNWENFTVGRNAFELSLSYPDSFLGFFFLISLAQMIFLTLNKSFYTLVVVLNFVNSFIFFIGMIRLSHLLGFQAVSFASVGAVFLVLIGNIIGLAFINKDKNLLKKYLK